MDSIYSFRDPVVTLAWASATCPDPSLKRPAREEHTVAVAAGA